MMTKQDKPEPPPPPFDPAVWDEGKRRARIKNNGGRARDWDYDVFGV